MDGSAASIVYWRTKANRLDVLERTGAHETVMIAYRTAACLAAAQGVEHRALDLLEAMYATGLARRLPE